MNRMWITGLMLAGLVAAAEARGGGENTGGDEAKQIGGTWRMVSGEKGGQPAPERDARAMTVVITADSLTFRRGDQRQELKLSIDPAASPKEITLTAPDGTVRPGIYDVDGDRLKLCLSGTDQRPKDFTPTQGTRNALMVLERAATE
jgi:uncharacterized protein (TIGR03067 family)